MAEFESTSVLTPGIALTEDEMRDAVQRRDRALDGRFLYAVTTTGVYCRPSCPSRPARPENLRFFTDIDTAKPLAIVRAFGAVRSGPRPK